MDFNNISKSDLDMNSKTGEFIDLFNNVQKTRTQLGELYKETDKFPDIDTSKIVDMSELFKDMKEFNGDISKWDVSKVYYMGGMFYDCKSFDKPLNDWDISKVTNMSDMFRGCKSFNQDISKWDVSNVTNMYCTFYDCKSFNQDLSNWDVSNVKDCERTFNGCSIKFKYIPKFNSLANEQRDFSQTSEARRRVSSPSGILGYL